MSRYRAGAVRRAVRAQLSLLVVGVLGVSATLAGGPATAAPGVDPAAPVSAAPAPAPAAPVTRAASTPRGVCPATSMQVVAHQDDDILFVNPDLRTDIRAGRCIVTLFLTAGDAGRSVAYWRGREAGAMAAYATMAGVPNRWIHRPVTLAGHRITRVALVGRKISLLFLRLPDGHGYANHDWETIAKLWKGTIPAVHSIDSGTAYTRDGLVETVGAAMRTWRPDVVRTLDYSARYGRGDHGDHISAGYVTYTAHLSYATAHRLYGYRGYPISAEPANLSPIAARAKRAVFFAYAPHDASVCKTEKACRKKPYWSWFARQHRTTAPPHPDALATPPVPADAAPAGP
ncbi:GlcNAc-PI de-N-acetylase [Krasilnikovia cinnamomea]|uniref:GlcNAc-PI de-N-acetylase n=1 Tax=Krasilnikovia cinnamomea TaxID=349313 RepID=A0A4Q7ZTE3_9ACTN|nr:PIG-L family deacetylase [Krasilnikovia cinnamomea]RZU54500.1 GlcNAc-PI de-N-acetylase [Krasilnikovia cinnamomea]